eukprot:6209871-Alexandrium_andersonii.AAC.1
MKYCALRNKLGACVSGHGSTCGPFAPCRQRVWLPWPAVSVSLVLESGDAGQLPVSDRPRA